MDTTCQSAVDDLNAKIRDYNDKVDTAKNAAANSKATIDSAVSELQAKKDQTTDETAKADLQAAIDKLNAAKSAADGLSGLEKASEVSVTIPTIDTTAIQQEMGAISVSDVYKRQGLWCTVSGCAILCETIYCGKCTTELLYASSEGWICGNPSGTL